MIVSVLVGFGLGGGVLVGLELGAVLVGFGLGSGGCVAVAVGDGDGGPLTAPVAAREMKRNTKTAMPTMHPRVIYSPSSSRIAALFAS